MKRAVVIGLGIFGYHIARTLFENGFDVVAIDKNKEVIQKIRDFFSPFWPTEQIRTSGIISAYRSTILPLSLLVRTSRRRDTLRSFGKAKTSSSRKPNEDCKPF